MNGRFIKVVLVMFLVAMGPTNAMGNMAAI